MRKFLMAAAAVVAFAPSAQAADIPAIIQQRPVMAPPVEDFAGGWYLRGDIGVGAQRFGDFEIAPAGNAVLPAGLRVEQKDLKDTFFFGAGLGYQWNSWLRFDVTGEYRGDVKFKSLVTYTGFGGGRSYDLYDGDHSAKVFLVNGYLDLGTWWCLTPFVGVGLGTAYHKVAAVTDTGGAFVNDGTGFPTFTHAYGFAAKDHTQWNLAWALHAGVSYNVTSNFKVELAYRYLNMGSVDLPAIACGGTGCDNPSFNYSLRDIDSHDFKLGVRWMLQPEAPQPVMLPPLVRKG